MRHIGFISLFFAIVAAGTPVAAIDYNQGLHLARTALTAVRLDAKPLMPWVSHLHLETSPSTFALANGETIYSRPNRVASYYDSSIVYDVSRFYKPKAPRLGLIMHYAGRRAGEIFSAGFDTGFSAEKIQVAPALFMGYTRAFQITEPTHISLSVGTWLGGGVSEQPCKDSYDREYWCPALMAWSDYTQSRYRLAQYGALVLNHRF